MAQNVGIIMHKDNINVLCALTVLICLEGKDNRFTIFEQGDSIIGFSNQYPLQPVQIPYPAAEVPVTRIHPERYRGVIPDKYRPKHSRK